MFKPVQPGCSQKEASSPAKGNGPSDGRGRSARRDHSDLGLADPSPGGVSASGRRLLLPSTSTSARHAVSGKEFRAPEAPPPGPTFTAVWDQQPPWKASVAGVAVSRFSGRSLALAGRAGDQLSVEPAQHAKGIDAGQL